MVQKKAYTQEDFIKGEILLFDKPLHWTSFNVVKKIRNMICRIFDIKRLKVGHSGTLDPLATGLIILCTGKATRKIEQLQAREKEYIATIKMGITTPSFDLETEADAEYPVSHITGQMLKDTVSQFEGKQWQTPPVFSAKRVNGKRAYLDAREGKRPKMTPAEIEIHEIELLSDFDEIPLIKLRIRCSKGTYIRSLANDLGKALKSGATLVGLKRTAIGDYHINDAFAIEDFEEIIKKQINNTY